MGEWQERNSFPVIDFFSFFLSVCKSIDACDLLPFAPSSSFHAPPRVWGALETPKQGRGPPWKARRSQMHSRVFRRKDQC